MVYIVYVRIKFLLFSLQRQLETWKRERERKHTSIHDINFDEKLYEAFDQNGNKKDSGIESEKSFSDEITEQLQQLNVSHTHVDNQDFYNIPAQIQLNETQVNFSNSVSNEQIDLYDVPPVTQQEAIGDYIYDVPPLTQQEAIGDYIYDVPPLTQQEAIDDDIYDVPPLTQQVAIDDDIYDIPPLTQQNANDDDIYDIPPLTQQVAIDDDIYDIPPLTQQNANDDDIYDVPPVTQQDSINDDIYDVPPQNNNSDYINVKREIDICDSLSKSHYLQKLQQKNHVYYQNVSREHTNDLDYSNEKPMQSHNENNELSNSFYDNSYQSELYDVPSQVLNKDAKIYDNTQINHLELNKDNVPVEIYYEAAIDNTSIYDDPQNLHEEKTRKEEQIVISPPIPYRAKNYKSNLLPRTLTNTPEFESYTDESGAYLRLDANRGMNLTEPSPISISNLGPYNTNLNCEHNYSIHENETVFDDNSDLYGNIETIINESSRYEMNKNVINETTGRLHTSSSETHLVNLEGQFNGLLSQRSNSKGNFNCSSYKFNILT